MKRTLSFWIAGLLASLLLTTSPSVAQDFTETPTFDANTIRQWGGHWAGPDLRAKARSLETGDIVGKPPTQVAPANGVDPSSPPPTVTPPSTPPTVTPPPTLPPVSVAPPPAQLPPLKVSGPGPFQSLIDNGSLIPLWIGQGLVAGEMLELALQNTTNRPIAIDLGSGSVLELEDPQLIAAFQPILLETNKSIVVPAMGKFTVPLRAYCLNYALEPPTKGVAFPYKFASNTKPYQPAIDVLNASLRYDAERNVLPVSQQKTVVIQRAVWASLGQTDEQKMYEDILTDAANAGKTISKKKARRLARNIWNEVERLRALAK